MVCEGPSAFVSSEVLAEDLHIKPEDVTKHGVNGFTWPTLSEGNSTIYANGLYKLGKFLVRDDGNNLDENPILFNIHSSETNARKIPDSLDGTLFATSKLMQEDEPRYIGFSEQLYTALPIPITWNCAGFGVGLQVAVYLIITHKTLTGKNSSAIVTATEVSAYDETFSGYMTTISQGSHGVFARVTFNPRIAEIDPESFSSYVFPETGFSKFEDQHVPRVQSRMSHISYAYTPAQAMHLGEQRSGSSRSYDDYDGVVHHRPIRSERENDAKAGFVSSVRQKNGEAWRKLIKKMGEPPASGSGGYTQLFDTKLYALNRGSGPKLTQQQTLESIQNDPDLRSYWKWVQSLKDYPDYDRFLKKIHFDESVRFGDKSGNSYSVTPGQGFGSLLHNADLPVGAEILLAVFGSESLSVICRLRLTQDSALSRQRIPVHLGGEIPLVLDQYQHLHSKLLLTESKRTITKESLIDADLKFLRRKTLPDGFHYINRDSDATGRWAFIRDGKAEEVFPLYVAPSRSRVKTTSA